MGVQPMPESEKTSPGTIARVTRSKAAAESAYDRMSRFYDWFAGGSERAFMEDGLRRLALREGERALEIGFGTGHAIVAMARSVGPAGRVSGVDLSGAMLTLTEARIRREGLAERVELRRGDGAALPYAVGSMDAVFLSFALELFDTPEIPVVLAECRRVLRPGGRIAVVAMSAAERPGLALRLYLWAHSAFPAAVDCRPIYAGASLQRAGFELLHSEKKFMWGLPVEIVLGIRPAVRQP
jgi:ubiquinone/menaquinone biosynthesis C-methylase UbiE